jgi:Cu/Ag efflux pump CusA
MRGILLRVPGRKQVSLEQVARVGVGAYQSRAGPAADRCDVECARGAIWDSFVTEVGSKIDRNVGLPPGHFIEYGGQSENQKRATRQLMLIVPLAIALIFVLRYRNQYTLPCSQTSQ